MTDCSCCENYHIVRGNYYEPDYEVCSCGHFDDDYDCENCEDYE